MFRYKNHWRIIELSVTTATVAGLSGAVKPSVLYTAFSPRFHRVSMLYGPKLPLNRAQKRTPFTLTSRVHRMRQNQFQGRPQVLTSTDGLDTHPA